VSAPEPIFRAEPALVINPLADETPEDQPKSGQDKKPRTPRITRTKIDFNTGAAYYVRIAGILLAICSGIAALLAVVNGFTSVKIAENSLRVTGETISALFSGYDEAQPLDVVVEAPVTGVTAIKSGGALTGYCVFIGQKGFGGTISLIVGTDPSGVAIGVKILGMSETPGLGSKTNDTDYLSQYIGKTSDITLGENIDAIAGATISSKAVYNAVKAALTAVENLPEGIAGAAAAETLPETTPETTAETTAETAGNSSEVTAPETTSETVSETTDQTAIETAAEVTEGGAV
jgi:electron transport complex protein RnfG